MRTKKGAILTLALAGAIVVGGSAGLNVSMAKNMNKEQIIQVEQKKEISQEFAVDESKQDEINQDETKQDETKQDETKQDETVQEACGNQVWQEQENIYMPEGAELKGKQKGCYEITWGDYDILMWQDKNAVKESKEDLGLAKVIPIIKNTIKQYSGQDMKNCQIEVSMHEPGEVTAGNNNETDFMCQTYLYDTKCYEVCVSGMDKHEYVISVDSVTGEVKAFSHVDGNLDDYTHGWRMEKKEDKCELPEKEIKEYESIIESFVSDDLKLGNVKKIFGEKKLLVFSLNNKRAEYLAVDKTDNGNLVEVMVDCGEKKVNSFNINAAYLLEEE